MKISLFKRSVIGTALLAMFSACGVVYLAAAEVREGERASASRASADRLDGARPVVKAKKKKVHHEPGTR